MNYKPGNLESADRAMNMKQTDVSVNITAHREGILVHKTLRSIYTGVMFARNKGIGIECSISLDNADKETVRTVKNFVTDYPDLELVVHEISVGDISLNRNYLVDLSKGKYLVFFDGDDFFTENYLHEAFIFAEKHNKPAIYSPRYLLVFEGDNYLVEKLDTENFPEVLKNMFETNYFIGQSFTHRDIYKKIKYQPDGNGYGMEDWHFSCEAAALGYKFYNVPNTIFFYRRKKIGSLLSSHVNSYSVIRPTKLFQSEVFSALQVNQAEVEERMPRNNLKSLGVKKFLLNKLENLELTHHYLIVQYTLHKNILGAIKGRYKKPSQSFTNASLSGVAVPRRFADIGFTEELVRYWGNVNQFEPLIRASTDIFTNLPIVGYPKTSSISNFYYGFCIHNKGANISDVVLVPHLTKGGADLAAINLIRELDRNAGNSKVLVVTTINADSPWLNQIKELKNVIFIEGKTLLPSIDDDKLISLVLRIIQNWGVKRLSIINSEIGYKLVTRHYQAIRDVGCRTYLHTYAFNMTTDGQIYNVISNGLVDAYKGVDVFVTDSEAYRTQLVEINAFDSHKIKVLHSPVIPSTNIKKEYTQKSRILWASRIGDDKMVRVAVEVGRILGELGIELDIYGALDREYKQYNRFKKMIAPYKTIRYKGSYNGFSSLDVSQYDMYLLTTKNEGTPFVILEACSVNIFVIAPAVGGVGDCVVDGVNGNIVDNKFDPTSYVEAIQKAYDEKSFLDNDIIHQQNKVILSDRSPEMYAKSIKELMHL